MHARRYSSISIYARLLRYALPDWPWLLLMLAISLAGTPLALLTPVPLQIAVDSVIGSKPLPAPLAAVLPTSVTGSATSLTLIVAAMIVLIALLSSFQQLVTAMVKTYVSERLVTRVRSQLFRHVQRLSLSYYDNKGTADTIYRIYHDAPAVQSLTLRSIIPAITAAFTLGSMLYVTAQLNGKLALIAAMLAPPLMLLTCGFSGSLRKRWREVKELDSSAQSVVQEVLTSVRVVKAFGREDDEDQRLTDKFRQRLAAHVAVGFRESLYSVLVLCLTATGTAVILFIGVSDVRSGAMTLGQLVLVMAYLKQLYEPVKALANQLTGKQKALASAERVLSLLDQDVEVRERPDARPIERAQGLLQFEDVSFSYDSKLPVLREISFTIAPGTRVGIIGRTGAGKTTLMNLLMRFYDPTAGRILLDGIDLRDYRLADLRNQFSIVLQEPLLFSSTIGENIAYGRPGASSKEIVAAAQDANAHDFIMALPEGYETPVGERGMRLSGGERQRISLARAFLRNAPILILDEPTSSIDTKTEDVIIAAMEQLMRGRTTLMIAHRLRTLRHCDALLQLDHGRLVQEPTGGRAEVRRALAEADAAAVGLDG